MRSEGRRTEGFKVHEDVVTTLLSEMLNDYGVYNCALPLMGRIPDIYMIVGGVRVILEVKELGEEAALREQLTKRLKANMCELAVGILYPSWITEGHIAPPKIAEVRRRLMDADIVVIALTSSGNPPEILIDGERIGIAQLPSLLLRLIREVVPNKEVDTAVKIIRESVEFFVGEVGKVPGADEIAKRIREVLET